MDKRKSVNMRRDPKNRHGKARAKRIGPDSPVAKRIRASRPTSRKNKDGSVSTVLMASSDRNVFPTLFPKKGGGFTDLSKRPRAAFAEAKKRGEVIVTRTTADADALARGSFKRKPKARKAATKTRKRVKRR